MGKCGGDIRLWARFLTRGYPRATQKIIAPTPPPLAVAVPGKQRPQSGPKAIRSLLRCYTILNTPCRTVPPGDTAGTPRLEPRTAPDIRSPPGHADFWELEPLQSWVNQCNNGTAPSSNPPRTQSLRDLVRFKRKANPQIDPLECNLNPRVIPVQVQLQV